MKKADWKREIVKKCESVGTYKKEFLPVINTLADILEERDRVRTKYRQEGSKPVVEFVSDRGAVNKRKNPLLLTWEDLNKDALAYWKELGLTAKAYKALGKEEVTVTGTGLEKILEGLAND